MANPTTRIAADLAEALRHNAAVLARATPRAGRGEVRAIHRLRVATRRLRESLAVEDAERQRLGRELRQLTKGFGGVRELDVARKILAKFACREEWPATIVARLDEYCERLRSRALEDARSVLERFDVRELRERFEAMAEGVAKARGATVKNMPVSKRLAERCRSLIREIDKAGTLYVPTNLHEVRIAAKQLRYVVEIAGELETGTLKKLKKLQGDLGRLHDAQVLQQRIQELAATSNDRDLVFNLTSIDAAIEMRCREWHAKILKTLPGIGRLAGALARATRASARTSQLGRRPVRMRPGAATPRRQARIA